MSEASGGKRFTWVYCTGAHHFAACPDNPVFQPPGTGAGACGHSDHVWFGASPALISTPVERCPTWDGNYAHLEPHCTIV